MLLAVPTYPSAKGFLMYLPTEFMSHQRADERSVFEVASRLQKRRMFDCLSGAFHDFPDEDPERTVVKSCIVAPNSSPAWVFDLEGLLNAAEAAAIREGGPVAHHAWISMPDGYDQAQATALGLRVASYVAWTFKVPVSLTLCHEWAESAAVEGGSGLGRVAEFEAELIFPARKLAVRDRADGDQTEGLDFAAAFSKKVNKKVRKGIELLVEEASPLFGFHVGAMPIDFALFPVYRPRLGE